MEDFIETLDKLYTENSVNMELILKVAKTPES